MIEAANTEKLALIAGANIENEYRAVLAAGDFPEIELKIAGCGCVLKNAAMRASNTKMVASFISGFGKVVAQCDGCLDARSLSGVSFFNDSPCYYMLMNRVFVDRLIRDGVFILTPGWLENWEHYIKSKWGLTEAIAHEFFVDSGIKRLALLDTGIYSSSVDKLNKMAGFAGLSCAVYDIGLDHLRLNVESIAADWRASIAQKRYIASNAARNRDISVYAMTLDLMGRMAGFASEDEIVSEIADIFNMLFAPERLVISSFAAGAVRKITRYPGCVPLSMEDHPRYFDVFVPDRLVDAETGTFAIKISRAGELFAIVWVEKVAFIEHIHKYITVAESTAVVCGLAISNARKFMELASGRERLEIALAEADKASKMKDMFLACMSHEIKTPLNSILGFSNLLSGTVLDEDQSEFVDFIKTSGRALLSLVNDILDFSRIEAGGVRLEEADFDPAVVASEALAAVRFQAAEKSLSLGHSNAGCYGLVLTGDPSRLRQVLTNLLSNAVKFTDSGNVELSMRAAGETAEALKIDFSVSDDGIGIEKDKLETIFSPFVQAGGVVTRRFGGTGLGLSIASNLVRLMGGEKISVESEPGRGSRFSFSLEFKKASAADASPFFPAARTMSEKSPSMPKASERSLCVLVADDNFLNRTLMKMIISKLGHIVIEAENGREAVEKVRSSGEIDMVLMDINMPVMDGIEATRTIRGAGSHVPIIAITATTGTVSREKCITSGMNDYYAKPFNIDTFNSIFEKFNIAS